jgi:hypothetical protein
MLRYSVNICSLPASPAAFVRLPLSPCPWGLKFHGYRAQRAGVPSTSTALGDRFASLSQSLPCGARRRLHRWPGHPSTPNPQLNPEGRVHELSKGQVEAMRARPWGDRSPPVPNLPFAGRPSALTPLPLTGTTTPGTGPGAVPGGWSRVNVAAAGPEHDAGHPYLWPPPLDLGRPTAYPSPFLLQPATALAPAPPPPLPGPALGDRCHSVLDSTPAPGFTSPSSGPDG